VIHVDECDHGSGKDQLLSKVYTEFRDDNNVLFILYSATPQEVLFSGEVELDELSEELLEETKNGGKVLKYTPPPGYCGPGRFLDEGLVKNAMPFFDPQTDGSIRLSTQGREIMSSLRESIATNPERNIIVLRLPYSNSDGTKKIRKENKAIYQFIKGISRCPELEGVLITVDKSEEDLKDMDPVSEGVRLEKIGWSDKVYWDRMATGVPMIFVIDQTASRSTEFVCHKRIDSYHCFRNTIVFTTASQADERVNHYEQTYGGFQPIRIYAHKKTFELSAGRIDYAEYVTKQWTKQRGPARDQYRIVNTADNSIHPYYNQPLSTLHGTHRYN